MASSGSETVREHVIPQVYLNGFSPEYKQQYGNKTIYCFNLKSDKQIDIPIPIKSICYEKNVYEVTGSDGNIVFKNHLEKFFGQMEIRFSKYRKKLESKAFNKENYKIISFLESEEKTFWITFIILQILRLPITLNTVKEFIKEYFKENVTDEQARNFSILSTLPFFKELDVDEPDAYVINTLCDCMGKMSFCILVDERGRFITSDQPIYIEAEDFPKREFNKLIYPITAQLCLVMTGGDEKKYCPRNVLRPVDDSILEVMFKAMICSSHEKIYLNRKLSGIEKNYIKEVFED